jgi:DNA-binding SARP family transcriptional activator/TolB-like protein/cytochrome c-type biogenesis protein CcmH/NrfG
MPMDRCLNRPMSKPAHVTLRLLGPFAIEANVGRPIPIAVRSRKARALLAYLAMQRDYRGTREELATLLWGDGPDQQARHSLRQCLIALRQDLGLGSEVLALDREAIWLRAQSISVDARSFIAFAHSAEPDAPTRASALWRGAFLRDLIMDIEEFDSWQRREADRLAAAAGEVFGVLCRNADAKGDGEGAIAAAERLIALEPTREDRQRTALALFARYKGRDAALSRATLFTDLLRSELGVAPEPASRALIDAIKRGDFAPAPSANRDQAPAPSFAKPASVPDIKSGSLAASERKGSVPVQSELSLAPAPGDMVTTARPPWRRRPLIVAFGAIAALGLALGLKLWPAMTVQQPGHVIAVLPFAADTPGQLDDSAFARTLTHGLIGYLTRFGGLRVISEQTSDLFGDHKTDVSSLKTNFGVQYAIIGHVQGSDAALKIDFQLVDTTTRTNIWAGHLQRERTDPTVVADEASRGIARMLAIEIDRLGVLRERANPISQLTIGELVARGYSELQMGTIKENLSAAMMLFDEALRRDPHYQPALLAVARVHIIAAMNFVDLDVASDLNETERVLNEVLDKSPNSIPALYSMALLQKYRGEYAASLRALNRCLELNPSFLPAQGQVGDVLIRMGQPQQGLEQILQTIRAATANDPTIGYWYLFAAEAELELRHDQAALDWALRADTFMPGSPLVKAWLASIYATIGDKSNAAKYIAALTKMAPGRTQMFIQRTTKDAGGDDGRHRTRILDGLRLAISASLG